MSREVTIKLEEVQRVYDLIEEIHYFFHQPMHFSEVDQFAIKNYPEIKQVYRKIVWEWLPEDVKAEIRER